MSRGGASSNVGEVRNPRDHRAAKKKSGAWSYASPPQLLSVYMYSTGIVNSCCACRCCIREFQVPGGMQVKDTFHSKILYGIIHANLFFSARPKADLEVESICR